MSFFKNIFQTKEPPIKSNEEFWDWFKKNESTFAKVVKEQNDIENNFFAKLAPKLNELKDGFYYLTGMFDKNTVELVLTPDGVINNIVFVEELVNAAPKIDGWRFTALKPALDITDVSIQMGGYNFSSENISFYQNDDTNFPDEIDITIVHDDFNEQNKPAIANGVYIFLDNLLGELNAITTIDRVVLVSKKAAKKPLVPIGKLKDFLAWRQAEFVEKYEGVRHDTESDSYSGLEAKLANGNMLLAIINMDLLAWDRKASHPWILNIEIKYNGAGTNGMPDNDTYQLLEKIEEEITKELKDIDGYLNIGRQTADGVRDIYFACKDFRLPSKTAYTAQQKHSRQIEISYDIYKDKYWRSFDHFVN
ncbi:DUF695 domain-containing protein [Mucilaginibacter flavidus]|uniref:DUF695 domain-containing protein n=1 Tax=Mucilaginibacter flavidus TaxID=2949309 RepID=UPI002092AD45|nr:DUF695 domain-containing protein [Mucilaginibacter flavidus]MCO5948871.1 DUF695 domain-containing protein [Mucilaginibacter flavidus]